MIMYFYKWLLSLYNQYYLLLIGGVWMLCVPAYGQNTSTRKVPVNARVGIKDSIFIDFSKDITTQLLPFEDLYELTLTHSPLLKYEKEVATSQKATYKLAKMQILQSVSGGGNYSTGNQAIISTGTGATGNSIGQIANGYRFGVNFQISLLDVVGRKQQMNLATANYQAISLRQEIAEQQIKRELINLYQDLVTAQQLLKLRLQDEVMATTAFQIAEVEFRQRKITAETFTGLSKSFLEMKSSIEEARGTFLKNLYNLEAVVGVPIKSLTRK
ncbi:TolC family protein [Runella sp.]|uniref:TolC family protein n=1 Tax=Runella sp. TaxID=1960881 RepID=UPI003D0C6579